jgi:hypothetical protein
MAAIRGAIDYSPHGTPELPNPKNADPNGGGGSRVAARDEQENISPIPPARPLTPRDTLPPSVYTELKQLIPLTLLGADATKAKDPEEDNNSGSPPQAQFAYQGCLPWGGGPRLLFMP